VKGWKGTEGSQWVRRVWRFIELGGTSKSGENLIYFKVPWRRKKRGNLALLTWGGPIERRGIENSKLGNGGELHGLGRGKK